MEATAVEPSVRVGPAICGLGVFAMGEFAADQWIARIEGQVIVDPDYESDYCMSLGEKTSLEPAAPFRYLNHSCSPNCALVEVEVEYADGIAETELWLQAEAAVTSGEEMTIDYGWPACSAVPCRCGSENCRQWIVAAEEVDHVP